MNVPRPVLFFMLLLLTSCVSAPLSVAYEPPSVEGAAFLVSEDNLGAARMFLIGGVSVYAAGIDGLPVRGARDRGAEPLPIRPGPRKVIVARTTNSGSGLILLEFEARAGETYFVRHEVEYVEGLASIFDMGRWFFFIADRTGARVTQPVEMSVQRPRSTPMPIFIPKGK